ncbi:solute carrier family 22 member 7-like isoform X2 [Ornithodoros turicata]|uniref:solute carrier family 22 member 7-like isoform X2 n=1 Tax=Ornithodoros turicata TaxID=34597 RepID=UPI0031393D05
MGTSTSPETQRGSSSPDAEDNTGIILGTGYFQRTTLLFASVVALVLGLNDFLPLLAVPEVDYWCASSHQVNVSEGKNMSIPVQENNSQCYMSEGSLEANQSVIPCTAWHYDHTLHYLTAVEEWNLVCNDSWLAPTSTAVYMLGSAVGTAAMGFLSDSIGRKPVSCIGSVATLLLCVAAINTKTIQAFILIRFLSGAAISGTGITIYVLKVIPTSRRALYAFVMWSGYSCGMTTIRTAEGFHVAWRSVQFGMIIPTALLLFVFAVLEESPRWLISQWDLANAERTILIIAKKNKRKRSDALDTWNKNKVGLELAEENYSSTLKVNLTRVLLTRQLRCSNIILCLSCFAISFTFFSMTFNTEDTLQIVVMGGIVAGIPPDIAAYIGMEHLGRKPTLVIALLLTALSCVAELILRDIQKTLWNMVTLGLGLFFSAVAMRVVSLYVIEVNPTSVRTIAVCCLGVCGRTGCILAAYSHELSRATPRAMPFVLYAMGCSLGGVFATLLPETRSVRLPEAVRKEDVYVIAPLQVHRRRKGRKSPERRGGSPPSLSSEYQRSSPLVIHSVDEDVDFRDIVCRSTESTGMAL